MTLMLVFPKVQFSAQLIFDIHNDLPDDILSKIGILY